MRMWTDANLLASLAEILKSAVVLLESKLAVSNEIKNDTICRLIIYPVKNVTEVYKGYVYAHIIILSLSKSF